MGQAVAAMDLPCDWAQFLRTCAERGIEDSALIVIATWHREGPAMTQQYYTNHGHPDGDIMTSILACHWFSVTREHHRRSHRLATSLGGRANFLHKGRIVAPCDCILFSNRCIF